MKWQKVTLGKLCTLWNGKPYKPTDWSKEGFPIIRIQNLNDHRKPFNFWNGPIDKQVKVKNLDVLLAWSGTPGTSFGAHLWKRGDAVLNQHIFRVDLNTKIISKKWAIFVINKQLNRLIDQSHGGVGLKHVTKQMVEDIEIPLPPLSEQKRIATILDKADAIRQKRQKAIKLADEFLRATFLDMFGDPVVNPKGWKIENFGKHCRDFRYGTSTKCDSAKGYDTCPVLRIPNIKAGEIDFNDLSYVSLPKNERKRLKLIDGDLLFVRTNGNADYIGRCAVFHGNSDFLFASYLIRARIKSDSNLLPEYVQTCISSKTYRKLIVKEAKTTAGNYNINTQGLRNLKLPMAPLKDQEKYIEMKKQIKKLLEKFTLSDENDGQLINSLTQRAFRGEL